MSKFKPLLSTLVVIALWSAGAAVAATCTAKFGANNWGSPSSWSGCGVPKDGDAVIIPSGSTMTLNIDTKGIINLTIAAGGVLLGDANNNKLKLKSPGDLTNNGTLTLNTAEIDMKGNLVNNGTLDAGTDKIQLEGYFSNSGTFNAQSSKIEFNGNNVQTVTGNVNFNDLKVDNGSGKGLLLNGNVVVSGSLSGDAVSGGLVTLANTCPFNYTLTSNGGGTVQNSCPGGGGPVADYRFDESSWNGSAGQVLDSSANAANGTALGGASTVLGKVCNAGLFNGTNQYVSVSGLNSLLSGTATLSFWMNTSQVGNNTPWFAPGVTGVEHHGGVDDVFWGWINATGKIAVNKGNTLGAQSTTAVNTGTWRHIVLTRDHLTGVTKAYVDGVLESTRSSGKNVVTKVFSSIGRIQNTNGSAKYLRGLLDEVKVFSAVLSDAQVSLIYSNENVGKNWDGTARVCPTSGPHHLEIQSSGSGLTCATHTITVRACADAVCTALYTGGVAGTLSAAGTPAVVWDGTTGGAAGAGFVIAAGSGSVNKNVQVTSAGNVLLGITAPTPAPTGSTTCNFGSPSCTFTANTAGFVFSNSATGTAYAIPAQRAGIPVGGLYLRALQSSTSNPAVCTPAIVGQTTAVDLGYTCNNPATCQPGNLATVNTTAIAPGGMPVSLTFDGNGSALVTLRYDDVGQITFNAHKTVTPFGGGTAVTLSGSSNAVVVAPHHFGFSGVTAGSIKAGANFAATVTAYNGLATPSVTANFGKEAAPEGVTLGFTKYQPTGAGAVNGVFAGNVGVFNAGAASGSNLAWSEVGLIDLNATLASGSYLGSGLSATGSTGSTGAVGPFIPDHFDVVTTQGCVPGGFTYSGQPVTLQVTAMNAATPPAKTLNYDGSVSTTPHFAKAITLSDANNLGVGGFLPSGFPASVFTAGVATPTTAFTFSNALTAPTSIGVRATDADASSSGFAEGALALRSGRIRLQNGFGSEKLPLALPVEAQYWGGNYFVRNDLDSCTTLAVPPAQTLATGVSPNGSAALYFYPLVADKNQLLSSDVTASLSTPLIVGKTSLQFTAPQKPGWLDVILQVPDYLRGDWGNCGGQTGTAGALDDWPCARASFGIFGNTVSPLIYRRENY